MANVGPGTDARGGESQGEEQSLLDIFVNIHGGSNGGPALKSLLGPVKAESLPKPRYRTLKGQKGADFLENIEDYRPGGFYPVDIGDEILGQFQVCHKLGHGRHATVWLAVNFLTPEWKAIKIFKSSCSEKAAKSYEQAKVAIETQPELARSNSILVPDDGVWVDSPNGRHLCLVLPLLGPKITHHERDPAHEQEKYLQQVVMCLRALHSQRIHHGGVHPGNLLQAVDVGDLPPEDILSLLGKPVTYRVKPAEDGDGEFVKAHAPKYLTAPTQGLARLPLRTRIVLTDVEVALTMNDGPALREDAANTSSTTGDGHGSGWDKSKGDMWGLAFTVLRMRRKLLDALPWQPGNLLDDDNTSSWTSDYARATLESALGSLFGLVESVLNTKDLNHEYLLGLRHLSVGELDLRTASSRQQNFVIMRALELVWKKKELYLLGDLLQETLPYRIRDWPLPLDGEREGEEERRDSNRGHEKPGDMASEYDGLTGGLESLLDDENSSSSSESERAKSVVEEQEAPPVDRKLAVTDQEEADPKDDDAKDTNSKDIDSKNFAPRETVPEETVPEEIVPEEIVPEETVPAASEEPKVEEKLKVEESSKVPFTTPVYSDEFDDFFTENPSKLVQSPEPIEEDPAEQSSEAPSSPLRSPTPSPRRRPATPPAPPTPPSPEPEPDLEPEFDLESEPESDSELENDDDALDGKNSSSFVRHRTINVILLGFTVAMALWTVVFTIFLLQAKTTTTTTPGGAAGTAARKPGQQPGILYLQTRRLSAHTSFFEGIMAAPDQSVPLDEGYGQAVFEGLDFFESEFGSLAE
ncbi:hypothetical protein G7054_g4703 [Neopestalotiopsis clavispora]|nr:hypothetical protein G7054_g4703 [Neopestalotiopsis clavispora]